MIEVQNLRRGEEVILSLFPLFHNKDDVGEQSQLKPYVN